MKMVESKTSWPMAPYHGTEKSDNSVFVADHLLSPMGLLRKRMCQYLGGKFVELSSEGARLRVRLFHSFWFTETVPDCQKILDDGPDAILAKATELLLLMENT